MVSPGLKINITELFFLSFVLFLFKGQLQTNFVLNKVGKRGNLCQVSIAIFVFTSEIASHDRKGKVIRQEVKRDTK